MLRSPYISTAAETLK